MDQGGLSSAIIPGDLEVYIFFKPCYKDYCRAAIDSPFLVSRKPNKLEQPVRSKQLPYDSLMLTFKFFPTSKSLQTNKPPLELRNLCA